MFPDELLDLGNVSLVRQIRNMLLQRQRFNGAGDFLCHPRNGGDQFFLLPHGMEWTLFEKRNDHVVLQAEDVHADAQRSILVTQLLKVFRRGLLNNLQQVPLRIFFCHSELGDTVFFKLQS